MSNTESKILNKSYFQRLAVPDIIFIKLDSLLPNADKL